MYPYATFTSFILCNRIFKTNLIRNVVHYSANLCNRIFNTNHIRNVIYHIRNVIDSLPQDKLNEKRFPCNIERCKTHTKCLAVHLVKKYHAR